MAEFKKIYDRLFRASIQGKTEEEIKKIKEENENLEELDCLLHPGDYPVVWKFGSCDCPPERCV